MDNINEPDSRRTSLWQSPWVNLLGRFLVLVLVFLLFAILVENGKFYSTRNLGNLLRQSAVYATAAMGMTMVIVAAGIDLSIGSIIALTIIVVASVLNLNTTGAEGETFYYIEAYPNLLPIAAVIAGIAAATLAGFFNGMAIVWLRIVPFIVTLGAMGIWRGVAKGIAGERDIYPPDGSWVANLMDVRGGCEVWPGLWIPPGVWIMLISAAVAAFILEYTRLGRHIYAIGSNEETARLCGVPVARTKIIVFSLAGLFAGLAGLMEFAYINGVGEPTAAVSYELFIIAAVVIGGGSLMGGEGSILGSLLGAMIITILYMGGNQADWPRWVQEIVIGSIIIGAVAIDRFRHRRMT